MTRPGEKKRLLLLIIIVAALTSAISHLVADWINLETRGTVAATDRTYSSAAGLRVAGSSLMFYGIDWSALASDNDLQLIKISAPSASPAELEQLVDESEFNGVTFLGISVYDMNENALSDFRAEIVPLRRTVRDLVETESSWEESKRVVSLYLRKFVRVLYPTAGRSVGVFDGIRRKLKGLVESSFGSDADPSLILNRGKNEKVLGRVSDWPTDRLLRNLAQMRVTGSVPRFGGIKEMALTRLFKKLVNQGDSILIVMPVSPAFRENFLSIEVNEEFESMIARVNVGFPEIEVIRLDKLDVFDSNNLFWDLVHLNSEGQSAATRVLKHSVGVSPLTQ